MTKAAELREVGSLLTVASGAVSIDSDLNLSGVLTMEGGGLGTETIDVGAYYSITQIGSNRQALINNAKPQTSSDLNLLTPTYAGAATAGSWAISQEAGGGGDFVLKTYQHGTNTNTYDFDTDMNTMFYADAGSKRVHLYANNAIVASTDVGAFKIHGTNTTLTWADDSPILVAPNSGQFSLKAGAQEILRSNINYLDVKNDANTSVIRVNGKDVIKEDRSLRATNIYIGGVASGDNGYWKIRPNAADTQLAFEYSTSTALNDANIRAFVDTNGNFDADGYVEGGNGFRVNGDIVVDGSAVYQETQIRHTLKPRLLLDFANSKRLDPRITYQRSSTALYYDGFTTVKADENLIDTSRYVGGAGWSIPNYTVYQDHATAPDGTTTATKVSPNSSGAGTSISIGTNVSKTTAAYTYSVYAKVDSTDYPAMALYWNSSGSAHVRFDIANGTVSATNNGNGTMTSSIQAVGNGWYRCSATYSGATSTQATIYVLDSATNGDWSLDNSPDGVKGMLFWGPQIEVRDSVTGYIETNGTPITTYVPKLMTAKVNQPRFNHDPVTKISKGLLVEEPRTNIIPQSEALWGGSFEVGYTGEAISPMGTTAKVLYGDGGSTTAVRREPYFSAVSGTTYTVSAYFKDFGLDHARFFFFADNGVFSSQTVFVRLSDGVVTFNNGSLDVGSQDVGGGWRRIWVTNTAGSTGTGYIGIGGSNNGSSQAFTGHGGLGIGLWGMQLEEGDEPTSHIPTAGTTVSRSAEVVEMNGARFLDFYNQAEGTWYAKADTVSDITSTNNRIDTINVRYSSGGTTDSYFFGPNSVGASDVIYAFSTKTNSGDTMAITIPISGSKDNTFAVTYAQNYAAMSVNGSDIQRDTSFALNTFVDGAFFGSRYASGQYQNGHLNKIAYYAERLTDSELIALTQD